VHKPKALDLFSGAGGASMGLHRAGFDVTGVDIRPQKNYPFHFVQADALEYPLDGFDFVWASPPCQAYTWSAKRWTNIQRADLLPATRDRLIAAGTPFVIENVIGAPLQRDFILCGEMFNLGVIRHRYFETGNGFACLAPAHIRHLAPVQRNGLQRSAYACVAGHGGEGRTAKLSDWRDAMGIDWMAKHEIVEAIPPAYSEFIGKQALQFIQLELTQ
jgi:hypothetical protein